MLEAKFSQALSCSMMTGGAPISPGVMKTEAWGGEARFGRFADSGQRRVVWCHGHYGL